MYQRAIFQMQCRMAQKVVLTWKYRTEMSELARSEFCRRVHGNSSKLQEWFEAGQEEILEGVAEQFTLWSSMVNIQSLFL